MGFIGDTPHETATRLVDWAVSRPIAWVYVDCIGQLHATDIESKARFLSQFGPVKPLYIGDIQ